MKGVSNMENILHPIETKLTAKKRIDQSKSLRQEVKKGCGMSFEAFLPSRLADWILEKVENGVFIAPSEAVFYLLQEVKELEPHHDLRK